MRIQISAGQGPAECEKAVGLLADELTRELADAKILSEGKGRYPGCFSSVVLETEADISALEGTVAWICRSPFRPHHKRKNWFIQVRVLDDASIPDDCPECKIEYFHCGGKGGQNVNKVETGVRLTHIATGISVTATEERMQQANRRIARKKLQALLDERKSREEARERKDERHGHYELVRGNPVRVYEGMAFRRKKLC